MVLLNEIVYRLEKEKYTFWCLPPNKKPKEMLYCVNEEGIIIAVLKPKGQKSMINNPNVDFKVKVEGGIPIK